MKKKRSNKKQLGTTRPISEQERVQNIMQAAAENKKSNDEPKSNSQKSKQESSLQLECSPELKRICLKNGADKLVDDMEEPREFFIVHDNICI